MDFNQIKYFLALAETLNFTRAAERAHISQPTLTQSIRKLEEELGGELVNRDGPRTRLTPLGQSLLDEFAAANRFPARLKRRAKQILAQDSETLRVGVTKCVPKTHVAHIVSLVLRQLPSVNLEISTHPSDKIEHKLHFGSVDMCLAGPDVALGTQCHRGVLCEDELVIAMHPDYFSDQDIVDVWQMSDMPWVLRTHCPLDRSVRSSMAMKGVDWQVRYQTDDDNICLELLSNTAVVALMPYSLVTETDLKFSRFPDAAPVMSSCTTALHEALADDPLKTVFTSIAPVRRFAASLPD